MNYLMIVIILISVYGIRYNVWHYNKDYLSPITTSNFNGIFVMMVFFSHLRNYLNYTEVHTFYAFIFRLLGQLIVASFFLYSGYGIMNNIIKKKDSYIKRFPYHRIFKIWYHFAIMIFPYYLYAIFTETDISFMKYLSATTGWISIGNSSWFILITFVLYIFTFAFGYISVNNPKRIAASVMISALIFIQILIHYRFPVYYYDTMFAYPLGMYIALHKDKIEQFFQHSSKRYLISLAAFLLVLAGTRLLRSRIHISFVYAIWVSSYCLALLLITMKLSFSNKILAYLGKLTFEIYVMQRICMSISQRIFVYDYQRIISSIILTGIVAYTFHRLFRLTDRILYSPRKELSTSQSN